MLSHLCGSAASYLVEGSGAHAPPPRFLRAPSLRDGLFVIPVAGGLCPLAWLDGAGCHPSTLFAGCGPLQPFTDRGCAMTVVCLPVRGAATRPCCDPEEVILPLRGGVYGGLTPSGDCPALCGGFRSGDLSEGNSGIDMVTSAACWLAPTFTARKGDAVLEEAMGLVFMVARQKEASRFW
jgi:hypothetical protein